MWWSSNLHLVGANVANDGMILPTHDVLIIDEAHALEEVMSESLGTSLSGARLRAVAAMARRASRELSGGPSAEATLTTAADRIVDAADQLDAAAAPMIGQRLQPGGVGDLVSTFELIRTASSKHSNGCCASRDDGEGLRQGPTSGSVTLQASARLRETLSILAELDERNVAWVEGRTRPSVVIAPIDVSEALSAQVFSGRSVVLTSATVPLDLAGRLGAIHLGGHGDSMSAARLTTSTMRCCTARPICPIAVRTPPKRRCWTNSSASSKRPEVRRSRCSRAGRR